MLELRPHHALPLLLSVAGLARSTFYYQCKVLAVVDRHADVKTVIKAIFEHHQGRYGYRRITVTLRQLGHALNHKVVQRLMQTMGLKSLVRPKRYRSYRGEVGQIAPNLMERRFNADRPSQKWVTDVTEFNVNGQKLYLSPIMDLHNREIIAYQTDRRPSFQMVSTMLTKAVASREKGNEPLVLHSDQGWQYQMRAFREQLRKRGIIQSMSRKGNCLDNAAMESFFGTLKSELFYLKRFDSVEQLEQELAEYIHYYNHDRIMLKLKGRSPVQYRTPPLAA